MADLKEYPCIAFDQTNETEFYLSEEALSGYSFVSIKLKEEDPLTIGYITKKKHILSDFGKMYVEELENINPMLVSTLN